MISRISFTVGKETLSGMIYKSDLLGNKANILFLHGAGVGEKSKLHDLAFDLLNRNISSFAFDFSGHGESSGNINESSLEKRVSEALAACEEFACDKLTICAFSMGGHVALELLQKINIENLILFCPAIYSPHAFKVPFTDKFTDIIRKTDSWKNAEVVNYLNQFSGKLLIIIGKNDPVIPFGVVEMIYTHAKASTMKEIFIVPNADHEILSMANRDKSLWQTIVKKIEIYSCSGDCIYE